MLGAVIYQQLLNEKPPKSDSRTFQNTHLLKTAGETVGEYCYSLVVDEEN